MLRSVSAMSNVFRRQRFGPAMTYVSCQFETPIGRSDYSDYVRELLLDISGCDADGNHILLGKIAADQVLVGDAQVDGTSLFDVCDEDSQGLHDAMNSTSPLI